MRERDIHIYTNIYLCIYIWSMIHGPLSMVHGPWSMVHGPWFMVHGPWSMVHGSWCMAFLSGNFDGACSQWPSCRRLQVGWNNGLRAGVPTVLFEYGCLVTLVGCKIIIFDTQGCNIGNMRFADICFADIYC